MSNRIARLHFADALDHLTRIRQAALAAADAGAAVSEHLHLAGRELRAGSRVIRLSDQSKILLIALGKAAPAMAESAASVLGRRLTAGVVAVPIGTTAKPPARVEFVPAGHPLPDTGSLQAAQRAARLLRGLSRDDLVLALISGGGSAMFELPMEGVRLQDLRALDRALLRSGTTIDVFNTIRGATSLIKGGGLARLAAPGRTVALIVSDVLDDRLSVIASGPTVLRPRDAIAARRALGRLGLWDSAPASIRECLRRRAIASPPAPRPLNVLVGNANRALEGARREAAAIGLGPRLVPRRLVGEATEVGAALGCRLRRSARPACWLLAGETTVHVDRPGRGGRNQELALAAAIALEGTPGVVLMTLATDGVDGPTDAAGAIVTGDTYAALVEGGVDPLAALKEHDSYTALDRVGALIHTGPTGTNVGDVVVCLTYPIT